MGRFPRSVVVAALGQVLVLVLCAAAIAGCAGNVGSTVVRGSGNATSENRPVAGVTDVALGTQGELTIDVGSQESLQVEADDNLLQYLQTTMTGGKLTIAEAPGIDVQPKKPIRYHLTVKSLASVATSSSGNITAPALTAGRFSIAVSSSGSVNIAGLTTDSLEIAISSSGSARIGTLQAGTAAVRLTSSGRARIEGGQVASQTVQLTSSGGYDAPNLRSGAATAELTSSGSATIWVTDRLDGNLSSSGGLKYYGSPQVGVKTTSSGKVSSLGNK